VLGTKRQKLSPGALQFSQPSGLPAPKDCIYVYLASGQGVMVPYSGWFEATAVSVSKEGDVVLQWSSDLVDGGHTSTVNLRTTRWLPCVSSDFIGRRGRECPFAWLERAAAGVHPEHEEPSARVFFARWWAEVRWGFVRFCVTPVDVVKTLGELQEARRFVAGAAEDEDFWGRVNEGSEDLSDVPRALASAILEARERGAFRFFKEGLFAAPRRLDASRRALHALVLLCPADYLGVFGAEGHWAPASGRLPQGRRLGARGPPAAAMAAAGAERLGPLGFLAAAQGTGAPNCDVCLLPGRAEEAMLVTLLPVLPMAELLAARSDVAMPDSPSRAFSELSVCRVGAC